MQTRIFKIAAFFLLLISGNFASGIEVRYDNSKQAAENSVIFNESLTKSPRNPYNYECVINSIPVQVNVQQHRGLHFWQVLGNGASGYAITLKYINLICGRGTSKLSLFRKLILFPFHVFW